MKYEQTIIQEVRRPAKGYALLTFKGDRPIEGSPGQFVMVRGRWGKHPILPRAFSLVKSGETGAILVRAVGEGTELLVSMVPGDNLDVLGPLGKGYDLPQKNETPILVAGGVGVAPLIFLANALVQQKQTPIFLYGARTGGDLPLSDDIEAICQLMITTENGEVGEKGLITAPLKRVLAAEKSAIVYSCGPDGLLKAVADVSLLNKCESQVALESPMACGMGTCKGCAVVLPDGTFRYVCTDGPVFDGSLVFGGAK